MSVSVAHAISHLLNWRQVIKNPKPATISTDHEIVEVLLNHQPIDRRARQIRLQGRPVLTIVERNVEPILSANIEQTRSRRVLAHAVGITQHTGRNAVRY